MVQNQARSMWHGFKLRVLFGFDRFRSGSGSTHTSYPPAPVAPDLTVPIDGTFFVTMTRKPATGDAILMVNNTEIGPMTINKVVPAGAFKKGDTILFDLKGVAHKNACFPSGWRIWTLRMGDGKYEFRVQEK